MDEKKKHQRTDTALGQTIDVRVPRHQIKNEGALGIKTVEKKRK